MTPPASRHVFPGLFREVSCRCLTPLPAREYNGQLSARIDICRTALSRHRPGGPVVAIGSVPVPVLILGPIADRRPCSAVVSTACSERWRLEMPLEGTGVSCKAQA